MPVIGFIKLNLIALFFVKLQLAEFNLVLVVFCLYLGFCTLDKITFYKSREALDLSSKAHVSASDIRTFI